MAFSLFGKKSKKEKEIDQAFEKVYAEISTIDNWEDPKKLEHYILDSCEQIIGMTKEIEGEKAEYKIVTAYLTDIQTIEKMPEDKLGELKEVAANIEELNKARTAYQNSTRKISDTEFVLMEQNEDDIPSTIHRLLDNERYLDAVKKDKVVLEAQKSQWEIERDDIRRHRKILRSASIALFSFYATLLVLFIVIQMMSEFDLSIGFVLLFAVGAFGAFYIFMKLNSMDRRMRQATRNLNRTIEMLNVVLLKYVNASKAVNYVYNKYHVNSSTELNFQWEQYTDAVREKERFLRNNDDLEFFNGRLMRILQQINLYDRKIWLNQTKALIDENEMTEIRHALVERRQAIRGHIDEVREIVQSERDEIDRLMTEHEHYVPEIIEIIKSVDKLCGLNQKDSKR